MIAVTSPGFVLFAALLAGLWYACPPPRRWQLMLGANLVFYTVLCWQALPVLLACTFLVWWCGRRTAAKGTFYAGLAAALFPLLLLKYLPAAFGWQGKLANALGIGYFTLQLISYLCDVRRGKLLPEESELAARFGQGRDPARAAAMRTALITGAALLLHNFPEGVLTFFAGTADPALGLRTAAAIALHNIPEGLAVAVPFAYATRSRAAGVLAALVSGLAEPLGAVLAWLFLRRFFTPGFLNGTVVLAAGIMVWVSFAQLLPDAFVLKHRAAGILGAAAGTLLMLLGIAALP